MFALLNRRERARPGGSADEARHRATSQTEAEPQSTPEPPPRNSAVLDMFRAVKASGATPADRGRWVSDIRTLVQAQRKALRQTFIADRSLEAYRRSYAVLAGDVVAGLLLVAQDRPVNRGVDRKTLIALAEGNFGRGLLGAADPLELLFIVARDEEARVPGEHSARFVLDALKELGFEALAQIRVAEGDGVASAGEDSVVIRAAEALQEKSAA
jgi:hypothetical protein